MIRAADRKIVSGRLRALTFIAGCLMLLFRMEKTVV